ncbi:hypothetical protein jhhlp_007041 [Lomentospora prolificans]|uniref:Ribosome biogenesis protein SLX9 n=1 Tax=Lomentospora prolificans TaxID=41688 RepID=A0A2N3N1J3_9PEZI|nr:hypothetical protein jhhlp_007041 [Lomentospora prolificans]
MLGVYLLGLDLTILATIVPPLTDHFGTINDVASMHIYLALLVIIEIGSIICALSTTSHAFIIDRAVNGVGSAGLLSGAFLIIFAACNPTIRSFVTSFAMSLISVGFITGPRSLVPWHTALPGDGSIQLLTTTLDIMAKTAPRTATEKRFARIRGEIPSTAPRKIHRPDAATSDDFIQSKRDRRTIKHSSFVHKIQKSTPVGARGATATSTKRRRPNKKLVATLEDLVDALPEVEELSAETVGKVRHKSLKSRPGALKRKEKIVRGEMERFGMSMARLVAGGGARGGLGNGEEEGKKAANPTGNRWAALRGYISATMEQNPAFTEKKS